MSEILRFEPPDPAIESTVYINHMWECPKCGEVNMEDGYILGTHQCKCETCGKSFRVTEDPETAKKVNLEAIKAAKRPDGK